MYSDMKIIESKTPFIAEWGASLARLIGIVAFIGTMVYLTDFRLLIGFIPVLAYYTPFLLLLFGTEVFYRLKGY